MALPDFTTLATLGGIGAIVAAGWSQFRGTLRYVANHLFVHTTLSNELSTPFRNYVTVNWQMAPSGRSVFIAPLIVLRNESMGRLLPIKLPPGGVSIWYRNRQFMMVTFGSQTQITSIRGFIDFDKLMLDVCEFADYHNHKEVKNSNQTRFMVNMVSGSEKGAWARSRGSGSEMETSRGDSVSMGAPASEGACFEYNLNYNTSLRYPKDMYQYTNEYNPFEHLYFEPHVEKYIQRAKSWSERGDWYRDKTIPWRLGWLLHGQGGTGKSSLAKAIAQRLKLPIYQFMLSTLSDMEFVHEYQRMQAPCVVLLEDFDTVFHGRDPVTEHKALSFNTVLNMISGVNSMNGVFVIITTNNIEHIDSALGVESSIEGLSTRPGRIDVVIEVGQIGVENRMRMANRILGDWPWVIQAVVDRGEGLTPAQFQELCLQQAFEFLSEDQA